MKPPLSADPVGQIKGNGTDIVTRFGVEEPDNGAKQWGALFASMRKAGLIEHASYTTSRRPTANGSACRQWVGAPNPKGAA